MQNAPVFECILRGAGGRHSNVHHGRYFPGGRTPPLCGRHQLSSRRRPNAPGSLTSKVPHRPPGAWRSTTFKSLVTMNGVDCVAVLQQRLVQVVCNSGAVRVFLCRLFKGSLPKGIFWFLTGNGTARCAHALHCVSPLRGVEDLPRGRSLTGLFRFLPQAMTRPQGHRLFIPLPLNGNSPCTIFFGRCPRVTDPGWAPRADRG